jgi:hypothetical protein
MDGTRSDGGRVFCPHGCSAKGTRLQFSIAGGLLLHMKQSHAYHEDANLGTSFQLFHKYPNLLATAVTEEDSITAMHANANEASNSRAIRPKMPGTPFVSDPTIRTEIPSGAPSYMPAPPAVFSCPAACSTETFSAQGLVLHLGRLHPELPDANLCTKEVLEKYKPSGARQGEQEAWLEARQPNAAGSYFAVPAAKASATVAPLQDVRTATRGSAQGGTEQMPGATSSSTPATPIDVSCPINCTSYRFSAKGLVLHLRYKHPDHPDANLDTGQIARKYNIPAATQAETAAWSSARQSNVAPHNYPVPTTELTSSRARLEFLRNAASLEVQSQNDANIRQASYSSAFTAPAPDPLVGNTPRPSWQAQNGYGTHLPSARQKHLTPQQLAPMFFASGHPLNFTGRNSSGPSAQPSSPGFRPPLPYAGLSQPAAAEYHALAPQRLAVAGGGLPLYEPQAAIRPAYPMAQSSSYAHIPVFRSNDPKPFVLPTNPPNTTYLGRPFIDLTLSPPNRTTTTPAENRASQPPKRNRSPLPTSPLRSAVKRIRMFSDQEEHKYEHRGQDPAEVLRWLDICCTQRPAAVARVDRLPVSETLPDSSVMTEPVSVSSAEQPPNSQRSPPSASPSKARTPPPSQRDPSPGVPYDNIVGRSLHDVEMKESSDVEEDDRTITEVPDAGNEGGYVDMAGAPSDGSPINGTTEDVSTTADTMNPTTASSGPAVSSPASAPTPSATQTRASPCAPESPKETHRKCKTCGSEKAIDEFPWLLKGVGRGKVCIQCRRRDPRRRYEERAAPSAAASS